VVLYYWQTDNNGYYSPRDGMDEKAKRHGHIRGWMRTGADGNYTLYTIRPAPYPNEKIPSHIHILILEPGIGEPYYIDDLVFDDDPLVNAKERAAMQNRGGNGILKTTTEGGLQVARHDIILGLNIPYYPK
jgi:protocatechuate 3,4-dioxygenase beta subunit